MKISELIKKTGVSKETIHYYIREGLLPEPEKTGKNTSKYDDIFISAIQTIKALQENYFLPLSSIKKIMKGYENQPPAKRFYLEVMSEYFKPFELLLNKKKYSKKELMAETGIGEKWIEKLEEWDILTARDDNGLETFSGDDVIIARLIINMDNLGFGPKDGYDPSNLAKYSELFSRLIEEGAQKYIEENYQRISDKDFMERISQYSELLALFGYFLFRKMVRENILSFVERKPEGNDALLSKE